MCAEMDDLIAELERAEEGSRELSDKALLASGWTYGPYQYSGKSFSTSGEGWIKPGGEPWMLGADSRPDPTRNLQDALGLVNGAWWEVRQTHSADSPIRHFGGNEGMFSARVGNAWGEPGHLGKHNKPALALCIACLKAREAENG